MRPLPELQASGAESPASTSPLDSRVPAAGGAVLSRPANSLEVVLRSALLDSRQRWRDLVEMLADIVWETDAEGRFTFISPDPALGWPSEALAGQLTSLVAADPAFDPFRATRPVRGVRAWMRRGDGSTACLAVAAVPLLDAEGRPCGTRGIARDVTAEEERDAAVARLLRKEGLIDSVLSATRNEVLADRMAASSAEALMLALGAAGVAILDIAAGLVPVAVVGRNPEAVLDFALPLLRNRTEWTAEVMGPGIPNSDDTLSPARLLLRAGSQQGVAVVLWRDCGSRGWDEEERSLLDAVKPLLRVVLAHRRLQRKMTEAAQIDPLTGLLNRQAFADEVERRIERLDHQKKSASLLFGDLDNFKEVNDRLGHAAGDAALGAVASLLRAAVRPSDLVARLGGDEFAIWLDGADEVIAADRAERLRQDAPAALAHVGAGPDRPLSISVGVAVRPAGSGESLRGMLARADTAMYGAKRAGRATWVMA
jgi:diguanylate cyclase (GGDEF)-like protein/PAS domain S-box-containing protein